MRVFKYLKQSNVEVVKRNRHDLDGVMCAHCGEPIQRGRTDIEEYICGECGAKLIILESENDMNPDAMPGTAVSSWWCYDGDEEWQQLTKFFPIGTE
jgi:predicted RNA-binding Zn-ribbon protein involved in translation (DUF1610 family)